MAGVFPKSHSYKSLPFFFSEALHFYVRYSLHKRCENRKAGKNHEENIGLRRFHNYVNRGKRASVYHESWNEVYTNEVYYGIEFSGGLFKHSVAPILMREIAEGVCPVCREPYAPE